MLLAIAAYVYIWIATDGFGREEPPADALRNELKEVVCVWWDKYNICICKMAEGPWGFVATPLVCDMENEWEIDRGGH
jgi:hypothetical protein